MMSPAELGLTPQQFQNFQLLEQFLRQPLDDKVQFNMDSWCTDQKGHDYWLSDAIPECGTIRCALGCGLLAGVPCGTASTWRDYCTAKFCPFEGDIYEWVFCSNWRQTDNTPLGAADRIHQLLESGCPPLDEIRKAQGRPDYIW